MGHTGIDRVREDEAPIQGRRPRSSVWGTRSAHRTRRRRSGDLVSAASGCAAPGRLGSIWIRGGAQAPERARRHVLAQLAGEVPAERASDAALIVSELVTNSVVHAGCGTQELLFVELTGLEGRLRIAVVDPGSGDEPRMVPPRADAAGGLGLRLVDQLSTAWGYARDTTGATRVWCEVPLDQPPQ